MKALTCQVLSAPYTAEDITGMGAETNTKPTVCRVLNLDTDEQGLLVVNAIIASAFAKVEGGILNKYFQLRGGDIREGKKYRDITVTLMEIDN